jgi:hypothetical protein
MTLSIPFPAIPIKLTIGKEKKEDAPIAKTAPASQSSALDQGDIAIVCVTAVAIVAMIVILIIAMRQGVAR